MSPSWSRSYRPSFPRLVALDLAEVTLVKREAIKFLAGVEAAGTVLVNCPEDVRSWIDAEQGSA